MQLKKVNKFILLEVSVEIHVASASPTGIVLLPSFSIK